MPSPFPGMDPFLEGPAIFPGLHDSMITYLREALQRELPEPYYAEIADRVWVEVSERVIGPNVKVLTRDDGPPKIESEAGGVASAISSEPVVVTVPHDEHREPLLQIMAAVEGERLVTNIELLSPTNKMPGSQGRELYLRKQREVLDSQVHLVEIDLLRAGEHTTAVPRHLAEKKAGAFDYHVCIHRFDNLEDFFVYPIRMEQPLPRITIPLLPGHKDVTIDLQEVFERCYDTGPYRRRIRYREVTPEPSLTESQSQWVSDRLADDQP